MKKYLLICLVSMSAACSTPKCTYYFDYYDYNSGKKYPNETQVKSSDNPTAEPFSVQEESLVASAEPTPDMPREPNKISKTVETKPADKKKTETIDNVNEVGKQAFLKRYKAMSKNQRKEFRKDLKNEVKNLMKGKKNTEGMSGETVNALDYDLKMAIIFGAVGLTLNLFGAVNTVFWVLGVIAIVIAVVFFIKWLVRQ